MDENPTWQYQSSWGKQNLNWLTGNIDIKTFVFEKMHWHLNNYLVPPKKDRNKKKKQTSEVVYITIMDHILDILMCFSVVVSWFFLCDYLCLFQQQEFLRVRCFALRLRHHAVSLFSNRIHQTAKRTVDFSFTQLILHQLQCTPRQHGGTCEQSRLQWTPELLSPPSWTRHLLIDSISKKPL